MHEFLHFYVGTLLHFYASIYKYLVAKTEYDYN